MVPPDGKGGVTMYYLEKLTYTAGAKPPFKWKSIYRCPERWPLALFLKHLNPQRYRITHTR